MTRAPDFQGLQPWPAGIEVIESVTAEGVVDMYNDSELRASTLTCQPVPVLSFALRDDRSGRDYRLEFAGVSGLVFRQDELTTGPGLWDPREVKTFYGVEFTLAEHATHFEVRTIVGDYDFRCDTVRFRWESQASPAA